MDDINIFQTTGAVTYKNYNANEKRLVLGLYISIPKVFLNREGKAEYIKDYPRFTITGDKAEELSEKIEHGSRISIVGHLETVTRMRYEGHSMYRQTYEIEPTVDDVYFEAGIISANTVIAEGRIIRVYKNADPGKRFYMINILNKIDGEDKRISFIYFDKGMKLEPEVGDRILVNGFLQTRTIEVPSYGSRHARVTQMSIVSRSIAIKRKNGVIKVTMDDPLEAAETETDEQTLSSLEENDIPVDQVSEEQLLPGTEADIPEAEISENNISEEKAELENIPTEESDAEEKPKGKDEDFEALKEYIKNMGL